MKKVLLWILSVFMVLMAMVAFSESLLSGTLILAAAIGCNPLFSGFLGRRRAVPRNIILIPAVAVLFLGGVMAFPSSEETGNGLAAQTVSEISKEEEAGTAEEPDKDVIDTDSEGESPKEVEALSESEDGSTEESTADLSELTVHFMDVGQGDSTLIVCKDEAMLIDAGDNDQGTKIQNYLQKQGISKLKYIIGTHPDADHIGGMDVILYKFDCKTVIMPDETKDTNTYRDVIDTMANKGYQNTMPVVGDTYALGDAVFTILSPSHSYGDSNNNSVVIRLTHGKNTFLFSGDAQEEAEADMLQSGQPLTAGVYKVGHHGSSTSSSLSFLRAVSPAYAVISCSEGNSYGHPHAEVLNNLRSLGIQVFRTDEQGTVAARSDGENLTWNCSPSESWQSGEPTGSQTSAKDEDKNGTDAGVPETVIQPELQKEEEAAVQSGTSYICNTNTEKFHYPNCNSVSQMKDENKLAVTATRDELIGQGYDPCGNCRP